MRVCIVNTFHYRRGGDSTYAFDLSDLLAARGHEVIHFAMKHPANLPSKFEGYFIDNVDYREVSERGGILSKLRHLPRSLYSFEAGRRFAELLEATRPDVIHLQNFRRHLTFSIVSQASKRRIPVVITAHDYEMICPSSLLFSGGSVCEACGGRRFYRAVTSRCKDGSRAGSLAVALEAYFIRAMGYYDLVAAVITPSRFARDRMVACGQDPSRISVIPNFIDASAYRPSYENRGYVISFGRLSPEKGIDVLVEAAGALPELRFVIAGDGPSRASLEDRAVKAGLRNADFIGYVDRARLRQLVAGAILVVMPSVSPENLPYSVLESFALGKPVVASRIGGIPELVEDGRTGLVFEPGSAPALAEKIAQLVADPAAVRRMGETARRRVETEFNASAHYQKLVSLYERVTTERRAGQGQA
ncbi:MAG: glycosyltransferase family 4 protein [bacterium]